MLDTTVDMTKTEFDLLVALAHLSRLRRSPWQAGLHGQIEPVRGAGYRLSKTRNHVTN